MAGPVSLAGPLVVTREGLDQVQEAHAHEDVDAPGQRCDGGLVVDCAGADRGTVAAPGLAQHPAYDVPARVATSERSPGDGT